jgi:transposase-like protein
MNSPPTVEELDAAIKELQTQREAALAASKEADLETVKRLCKQHGFTATQLRSSLKTRAKNKKADDETAATKPTTTKKPTAAKKK